MDSRTRSRPRNSVGRELFVVARAEAGPLATGREDGDRSSEDASAGTGLDPDVAEGTPCKRQGSDQFIRSAAKPGNRKGGAGARDLHSTRTAPGSGCNRGRRSQEGVRRWAA